MMNRTVIREPTAEERETLGAWERSGAIAWYQRARAILLAQDGLDATAIARALGLHPNTTRRWLHRFDQEGLAALAPQPRGGSAKQFGTEVVDALIALLHEPPPQHGASDERWTLKEAAAALIREGWTEAISIESVRRVLRARKHSWQRAKEWLTSPDPAYARKKSGATGCCGG
jgi:transposase